MPPKKGTSTPNNPSDSPTWTLDEGEEMYKEIRSGPNPKIRKVGPSDLEDVFKEAPWRV